MNFGIGKTPPAAQNRKVSNGSQFDKFFKRPEGRKTLLKRDGEVEDTIAFMKRIVKDNYKQCKEVSEYLSVTKRNGKLDQKATVENIWNFIVKYIKYNFEVGEQLRTPCQTWHDGQVKHRRDPSNSANSADCDCFSIFVGSCLKCLGIPFSFRVTGYGIAALFGNFQHVYVIAHCDVGDVICDPVYTQFDSEKQFQIKKDFYMSLSGTDIWMLSGIGEPIGSLNGRRKRKKKSAGRDLESAAKVAVKSKRAKGFLLRLKKKRKQQQQSVQTDLTPMVSAKVEQPLETPIL